jgi:hypothetical protein
MGIKNITFLGAHVFDELALNLGNLLAGLDERLFEPADFRRYFPVDHLPLDDDMLGAVKDKNLPTTNAGGNGNAAKQFFSLGLR